MERSTTADVYRAMSPSIKDTLSEIDQATVELRQLAGDAVDTSTRSHFNDTNIYSIKTTTNIIEKETMAKTRRIVPSTSSTFNDANIVDSPDSGLEADTQQQQNGTMAEVPGRSYGVNKVCVH